MKKFQDIADRCRQHRLGYADGQPGTPEDIEAVLDEYERNVQSWSQSVNRLNSVITKLEKERR